MMRGPATSLEGRAWLGVKMMNNVKTLYETKVLNPDAGQR